MALLVEFLSPPGQIASRASTDRFFGSAFPLTADCWQPAAATAPRACGKTATGALLHVLRGHTSDVNRLAFSPDGDRLATASDDKSIAIWDPATGEQLKSLHGHADMVVCLAYVPEGRRIVSGSADGDLKTWEAISGREIKSIQAHDGRIHDLAISDDGWRILQHAATINPSRSGIWNRSIIRSPSKNRLRTPSTHCNSSLSSRVRRRSMPAAVPVTFDCERPQRRVDRRALSGPEPAWGLRFLRMENRL